MILRKPIQIKSGYCVTRGMSDMDSDGRLSCEEFVLAMHLCDMARSGEKIPVPLPPDLVPPSLRRQRQNSLSASEMGDPLAGMSGGQFTRIHHFIVYTFIVLYFKLSWNLKYRKPHIDGRFCKLIPDSWNV